MRRWSRNTLAFMEDDGLDDPEWAQRKAAEAAKHEEMFKQLHEHLPHAAWLETEELFAMETSPATHGKLNARRVEAMGFTLELTPLCGADSSVENSLRGIVGQLPKGAGIQVIVFGDPRVNSSLDEYASLREGNATYHAMAHRRQQWYIRGAFSNLFPGIPYRLRKQRVIVSISVPVDGIDARSDIDRAVTIKTTVKGILSSSQLMPRVWKPSDWIEWMTFMANPDSAIRDQRAVPAVHDRNASLRLQAMHKDTCLRVRPRHLLFGDHVDGAKPIAVRAMSAQDYPIEFDIGEVGALLGDMVRRDLQYPCPYMICLGIMVLDYENTKSIATIKSARATTNASSPMARFMPDFQDKQKDWDNVMASFDRGEGIVQMFHQVLLFDTPDALDTAERTAEQIWRARSFQVRTDRYMQMQSFLSCVPMGLTQSFQEDLRKVERFVTRTVANATNTMPIVGEWSGIGSPMLVLWGRQGQFMGIDLFSNPEGNYNVSIAAGSGAGKSVLGSELIASVRGVNGQAYVIDAGRSYEKSCRLHNGQFIEFTPESVPNFNPFPMVRDLDGDDEAFADAVVMIAQIVNSMAAPERVITDYEQGIVEQVVQEELEELGNQGSITGIYKRLIGFKNNQTDESEPIAGQLAQSMKSYAEGGVFARYFTGSDPIKFQSDFVVLELDGLNSMPRLQSTVLMIVMFNITQSMYTDRVRRKIVLIDEAWALMREGATAKFIETGYRRARKYNGQFVTITQSFNDYFKTTAARAAYDNSDWKISLRQSEESWAKTFADNQFVASTVQQQYLRSLRTDAGLYAEVFIKMPQGWGVGRLILDPATLLEYSTKAEDFNAVKSYQDRGLNTADAIAAVLRDRGVELPHANKALEYS